MLIPEAEGIPVDRLDLGDEAFIGRTVDIGSRLSGLKSQPLEIWWSHGGLESEKRTVRYFEWRLDDVEAVIDTDHGVMTAEFYPDKAPGTVANFIGLALDGFYEGLTFHRIVPDFMIQGGCPNGDGTGDPGYYIKGEFSDIEHVRGVLSMARTQDPDSAGCQFFIMHGDNLNLDGLYAAFGRLVSGLDALDRIAASEITHQRSGQERSRPVEPPVIRSITIRPKARSTEGTIDS